MHPFFQELKQGSQALGLTLSDEALSLLLKYQDALVLWNKAYNLTAIRDPKEMLVKHLLDSLSILNDLPAGRLLDVGTGGGFPGIPLAILFPNCTFHLVDSIAKKLKVVDEVVEGLGLTNVKTTHSRVEDIDGNYDFIVSRAVAIMPTFVHWVKGKIAKEQKNDLKNGILYLKGGDLTEELQDYRTATIYNLSDFYTEDFYETKKVVHLPMKYKG